MPFTRGSSGPTTTMPIFFSITSDLIAGKSVGEQSMFVPNRTEPALPGAMKRVSHFGLWDIFQASAFSRPPEPRRRMFMGCYKLSQRNIPVFFLRQRYRFVFKHLKSTDQFFAGGRWADHFINITAFGCFIRISKNIGVLFFFFFQLCFRIFCFGDFFPENNLCSSFGTHHSNFS